MSRPLEKLLPHSSPRNLRYWALVGVVIALMQLSDPLADATAAQAALFWGGRIMALVLSLVFAEWLVGRYLAERWQQPPWLKPAILTMLIAVVPMSLVEVVLEAVVPVAADQDDSDILQWSPLLAAAAEYLTLASVLVPVNLVLWLLIDQRKAADQPVPADAPAPAFLSKTNGLRLEDVIALQAEEHYVRVHTTDGAELIHHRLSDAVGEMPAAAGLRVHRSWWVAEQAVASARRGERRYRLELSNGLSVPVSDSFTAEARARGLLRRRSRGTLS